MVPQPVITVSPPESVYSLTVDPSSFPDELRTISLVGQTDGSVDLQVDLLGQLQQGDVVDGLLGVVLLVSEGPDHGEVPLGDDGLPRLLEVVFPQPHLHTRLDLTQPQV